MVFVTWTIASFEMDDEQGSENFRTPPHLGVSENAHAGQVGHGGPGHWRRPGPRSPPCLGRGLGVLRPLEASEELDQGPGLEEFTFVTSEKPWCFQADFTKKMMIQTAKRCKRCLIAVQTWI